MSRKITTFLIAIPLVIMLTATIFSFMDSQATVITMGTVKPFPDIWPDYEVYRVNMDWQKYVNGIDTVFSVNFLTRIFPEVPTGSFGADVAHNFELIADWIEFLISIVLLPIRMTANVLASILVFLGINLYNPEITNGFLVFIRDEILSAS